MQFEYTEPQTEFERLFGGHFCINAFGPINVSDEARFLDFLNTIVPPPRIDLYINSGGGDVHAAMEMGRIIRSGWFATSVGTYRLAPSAIPEYIVGRELIPGKCMSAATLMYLGGRLRYLDKRSQFGVHQFSFRNPTANSLSESQVLSARISRYLEDMGIPSQFLELTAAVPSNTIQLVDHAELEKLKVVTGGQTAAEWTVQALGKAVYVRGERDSIFGHHKVILGYEAGSGFFFYGVIEAQGREAELTGHKLVQIVVNGEDNKIDVSDRCSRSVNGIYVNVFVKIAQAEAKLLAESESFGVQIKFAEESEVFLGIGAMDTASGRDKLQGFYAALSR